MAHELFRIGSWLSYVKHRRTNQYIHSPFLFELMNSVFDDSPRLHDPGFTRIESLRAELITDPRTIRFMDYGAGAASELSTREVRVSDIAKRSLKQPRYGRFLYRLAKHVKATTIVELGTCFGITTSYLYLANEHAAVSTIEGDPQVLEIARTVWQKQNMNTIRSYSFDLNKNLAGVLSSQGKIDFLFIDANHRKEAMLRYYSQAKPFLHENSVVVFDDINWSEDTASAWELLKKDPTVTLSFDIFQMGFVFFDKRLSKENFTLKY